MIRRALPSDHPRVLQLAKASGLFDEKGLATVASRFLARQKDIWLVRERDELEGVIYCSQEELTEGTWNALMLIVSESHQGMGVGRSLMEALESALKHAGARILLVETSSGEEQDTARVFYPKLGFREVSRIEDYYADGYDKITYGKRI